MERHRDVVLAGHRGDADRALLGLADTDPQVRVAAIGALARLGPVTPADLVELITDTDPSVRRRMAELLAHHPGPEILPLVSDTDPSVLETALWAAGEHAADIDPTVWPRILDATTHDDPLCREAAVAALGAIGRTDGIEPVLAAASSDKPAIRRRAIVALAAFDDPRIEPALRNALDDRDWQVRQAAETLLDISGTEMPDDADISGTEIPDDADDSGS